MIDERTPRARASWWGTLNILVRVNEAGEAVLTVSIQDGEVDFHPLHCAALLPGQLGITLREVCLIDGPVTSIEPFLLEERK